MNLLSNTSLTFQKRLTKLFNFYFLFLSLAMITDLCSQTPSTGPWLPNNQTTTQHDLGVGTSSPRGKQEIIYCPQKDPQDGLIVTAKDCNPSTIGSGLGEGNWQISDPNNPTVFPTPALTLSPFIQTLPSVFSSGITKNNLFWVRTEDYNNLFGSYNFKTHFIVNDEGKVGVNTMNPRAQFDVVQPTNGLLNNTPTAIFSKRRFGPTVPMTVGAGLVVDANRTSQIMFFNRLGAGAYNSIIQNDDQAIIYSDGGNADGSNVGGTFAIAPWGTDGGLRMDANGNTELRGNLRTTNLVVDAQWWPDFVFHRNYNLMPLSDVAEFIKTKHHLPGMPSQDSVMNSGQDVGELQKLQQQKIEELTLYTIQQDEQLKAQEVRLKELEAKLNAILNK
jgi:hypothetical protein